MASGRWTSTEDEKLREFISQGKEKLMEELQPRTWRAIKHRVDRLGLTLPNSYTRYTENEDSILRAYYGEGKEFLMSKLPNRDWESIRKRLTYLNLDWDKKWRLWTKEELEILSECSTIEEAEEALENRSREMILRKSIEIKKIFVNWWSEEEEKTLIQIYPTHTPLEVAETLGRSIRSIYAKAHKLGLRNVISDAPVNKELAIEMFKQGHKIIDIADIFQINYHTMKKIIPNKVKQERAKKDSEFVIETYKNGKSMRHISMQTGFSEVKIRGIILQQGLEIRDGSAYYESYRKNVPLHELVDLYLYGYSSIEIGEIYNVSPATVVSNLRDSDIVIRMGSGFYNTARASDTSERKSGRNIKKYRDWKSSVHTRDDFICTCCGQDFKENKNLLHAHHIHNYSAHEEIRYDVKNGVSLCYECHMPNSIGSFHHTYGTWFNDIYQLQEYFDDVRASIGLPLVSIESIVEKELISDINT